MITTFTINRADFMVALDVRITKDDGYWLVADKSGIVKEDYIDIEMNETLFRKGDRLQLTEAEEKEIEYTANTPFSACLAGQFADKETHDGWRYR